MLDNSITFVVVVDGQYWFLDAADDADGDELVEPLNTPVLVVEMIQFGPCLVLLQE